jgi:DNA mismatch endonuclease Vsr
MDVLTKEQRRRNMQAIRSTDTKTEILLAKSLFALGFRYRKNDKTVFGRPDLTFKKLKIAVFVDSEYFMVRTGLSTSTALKQIQNFGGTRSKAT